MTNTVQRYPRIVDKELYQEIESLMRHLYFYQINVLRTSFTSYDPTSPSFKPENVPFFHEFYKACDFARKCNISAKEYLIALVEYRKTFKAYRFHISEEYIFHKYCVKAVHVYLENKSLYQSIYIPWSSHYDVRDPKEMVEIADDFEQSTWDTFYDKDNIENTYMKILSLPSLHISSQFIESCPSFQEMIDKGKIRKESGVYVWVG